MILKFILMQSSLRLTKAKYYRRQSISPHFLACELPINPVLFLDYQKIRLFHGLLSSFDSFILQKHMMAVCVDKV